MYTEELLRVIDKERELGHTSAVEGEWTTSHLPNMQPGYPAHRTQYQPQILLGFYGDSEPEREGSYFTCEWCGADIDESEVSPKAPRKPAISAGGEPEDEWARRVMNRPGNRYAKANSRSSGKNASRPGTASWLRGHLRDHSA